MSQVTTAKDPYIQAYHNLEKDLPGLQAPWVRSLRTQAIEAYQELGWPTTKQEAWKYTDLKALKAQTFAPATGTTELTAEALDQHVFEELDTHLAVLVNGRFVPELSQLPDDDDLTVASLATVLQDDPESLEGLLGQITDATEHPFRALNTALFQDGVVIDVPANTVLDKPVHVLHLTSAGQETPVLASPRVLIHLGTSAQANVIETYGAIGQGTYFTNGVTEIQADKNATLRHYKLELEDQEAFHIATQQSTQARDATVRTHNICLGGQLTRNDVGAVLNGQGGECLMNGLFNLIGDQHCDNHTRIDHVEPHCESHQLYKGIVDDTARGVFWGRIFVEKIAQQTNADQHNPNLLLSDEALVNSTPQLEIFADDVRCTHGSTFGRLDEDQIFYMRSRGLDNQTARAVLTYAFAAEVTSTIELAPVRERVEDMVLDRLPKGDLAREALG